MNKSFGPGLSPPPSNGNSILRPRNPRLISYLEEGPEGSRAEASISRSSKSSSPANVSQSGGDLHNAGLFSTTSVNRSKDVAGGNSHTRAVSLDSKSSTGSGLWDSFSQLQSIASTLLGSDLSPPLATRRQKTSRTPTWLKYNETTINPTVAAHWGPNNEVSVSGAALNTADERKALVQAKKREALLLASTNENRDTTGRFKRKDSGGDLAQEQDENVKDEALVYIHKIQPQDTLPGVLIKYNCEPEAFRKVNRFWPNDNIQTRSHVFLPVEACSIRGKKIDVPHQNIDLLDPEVADRNEPVDGSDALKDTLQSSSISQTQFLPSSTTSESKSLLTSLHGEEEYQPDSWVLIQSFKDPVQILRIPRRLLGYFPRARRKSNAAYTDKSTNSTPKTSFDMLRHPPTHAAQQTSLSLNASPIRRPTGLSHLQSDLTRQRSSSISTNNSGPSFVSVLKGPGGVGTLRGLRTEISRPGPADDPLNRKFAQYLPDLAPPEDMPRTSLRPTPRGTPRASMDSIRSNRSNSSGIGDMSGALEGWVRKFASNSNAITGGSRRDRSIDQAGGGAGGLGGGKSNKMGEIIELETNSSEYGGEHLLTSPDLTDPERTPTALKSSSSSLLGPASTTSRSITATEEAMLNERFPIRGRSKNIFGLGIDKDKDD